MRNVPYTDRIRNFVDTNVQIGNIMRGGVSDIVDYRLFDNQSEELRELKISDLSDIWIHTMKSYLQNMGIENLEPQHNFLDGIRMYHTNMPMFAIIPPVSYRTLEEIRTGICPQYTFDLDTIPFNNHQHLVDYLTANLIQGYEIFLYSVMKAPIYYNPIDFDGKRRLIVRLKVIDWATKLNRTDFSFLKIKKDFTPTKKIPKFDV